MSPERQYKAGADFSQLYNELNKAHAAFLRLRTDGKHIQDVFVKTAGAGNIIELKLKEITKANQLLTKSWKTQVAGRFPTLVGKGVEQLSDKTKVATKSTKDLLLSWHSLVRLFGVQLLHQAVSAFVRGLKEGVKTAQELQKRIGEIQTISQDMPMASGEWLSGLRDLSDAWGLDIMDQAEAAYQTLSNQVAKGAETFEFLAEANRFAVTAVSSTSDAVNLLTAALNAFDIDVSQTDKVAASFFKTIELGRVRASEMSQTFGRMAVPAHQLGISLDELNAATATGTIQGVQFSEVTTLIRNVLLKLIRPTSAMKEFFHELGVNTGQAAIAAYGFNGILAKLEEKTGGSAHELGNLFGRIRAITGAMLFAGKGFEKYEENLNKITKAQKSYDEATEYIMEKAGKKLEIEMNKIKNFFLVDMGDTILTALSDVTGGFEGFLDVIKFFAESVVPIAITAVGLLITKLVMLAYAHPYTAMILELGILISLIRKAAGESERLAQEMHKQQIESIKRRLYLDNWYNARLSASIDNQLKEMNRLYAKETVIIRKEYFKQLDLQSKKFELINKGLKRYLKDLIKGIKTQIKETEKAIKDFDKSIKDSQETIRDITRDTSELMFEWDLDDLDIDAKIKAINDRMQAQRAELLVVAKFGDKEAFDYLYKEILKLAVLERKLIKETNKEDEKARKKLKELTKKNEEERTKFINKRSKLELQYMKIVKKYGEYSDEAKVKYQELLNYTNRYNTNQKEILAQAEALTIYDLEQVEHKNKYLKLTKEIMNLKEQMIIQEEKLKLAAQVRLSQQEIFGQSVKNTIDKYEKFDVDKVFAMTDPKQVSEYFSKHKQYLEKISELNKKIGYEAVSQIELERAAEYYFQIERIKNNELRMKAIEDERKQKLLTIKVFKEEVEINLKALNSQLKAGQTRNEQRKENNRLARIEHAKEMEIYNYKEAAADLLDIWGTRVAKPMPKLKLEELENLDKLKFKVLEQQVALYNLSDAIDDYTNSQKENKEVAKLYNDDVAKAADLAKQLAESTNAAAEAIRNLSKASKDQIYVPDFELDPGKIKHIPKAQGGQV
jgi:TP901 family phage tail tape measure protein